MKVPWIPDLRIDWPNHFVAFFSALFGILIAFELDEWREERKERELALMALTKMKEEVATNQAALHETTELNAALVLKIGEEVLPVLDNNLAYLGPKSDIDSINQRYPSVFQVERIPVAGREELLAHINLGGLFLPTLHNSAWESAKTTGALNFLAYEKVQLLSSLYSASRIHDELLEVKSLLRQAGQIKTKTDLAQLLSKLADAFRIIEEELAQYDMFVNMLSNL